VLSLPVLALVPAMTTTAERRKAKRRRMRVLIASTATFVIAMAILAWRYSLWNRFL